MNADVLIDNEGTIVMFQPVTPAAQEWFAENVETESWQWFGSRLGVDHRMANNLIAGILSSGLTIN